ncbi:hypothetical protein LSH36_776g02164 [Paralvinella palmiformis]|uniref:SUEL-type lectin domain-containing protein n=1 Tax=Paralvinella palmiformis TaxID=53620 RepID=A0AAD9J0V8_9ANNE|nr:hypothetical protein LSH36_776g02164 [Paralvinella palmiformis]
MIQMFFLTFVSALGSLTADLDVAEVCPGETLRIQCPEDHVIIPTSAMFGRMEVTRCIDVKEFIGCRNDVLFLIDRWCSGRRQCEVVIPNPDLKQANEECLRYLQIEGFLSSDLTDNTGCGSTNYPWIISGISGQTIELTIIDFDSEELKKKNTSSGFPIYGYVIDGTEKLTIRGDTERERHLLSSKTSQLSIEILQKSRREGTPGFILHYTKSGCPDLSPPAHAWYKRDGDQAVIGCEWSQKTWHLSCDGHSWSGVVGNCSEIVTQEPIRVQKNRHSTSVMWLVCVISVAVVLMVIACVTGIVCMKKYRIKQDVQKSMTTQMLPGQGHYDLDPNIEMASMLYLPYKLSEEQQQQQGTLSDPHRPTSYLIPQDQVVNELTPIRIWERPLPDIPDKPLASDTTSPYPPTNEVVLLVMVMKLSVILKYKKVIPYKVTKLTLVLIVLRVD